MNDDGWTRIEDLFLEALELPEGERAAFLDRVCGGDAELRSELAAMLSSDATQDWLLMQRHAADPLNDERPLPEGRRLGPYAILRQIGKGGMGQVYLAERVDEQYRQKVALKVLRGDLALPELEARFRAERQILARLQHPNVSTLLDGGITDDGRPYLVMQYVDGLPITQYADEHGLNIAERLRLFSTVCDAVQFAHSNLVVHRDLKPSNILVDDDGRPCLLDFGIAKILEGGGDPGRPVTRDVRMMTPEHAAPEQISGGVVTTGTDVYALGVLLSELLTGMRPFRAGDGSAVELQRQICEDDPTRPSELAREIQPPAAVATHPAVLRGSAPTVLPRLLSGDLDQIVLMALRKEPERRYSSAGAFGEDVRRYLAGMPVEAQPDSRRYRVGKFVRRHGVGVAAAGAFVVLLGAFGTTMAVQRAETARQRDRAELELANTQAVTDFVVGLFDASRPEEALGREITAREVLEQGTERVEQLADQPQMHSGMLAVLGRIWRELGDYDVAAPFFERALTIREADSRTSLAALGSSLHDLANMRLIQGRFDEAEPLARRAIEVRRADLGDDHPAVLSSLALIGRVQREVGDYASAETTYREILTLRRSQLPEGDLGLVNPLLNVWRVLDQMADYQNATAAVEEAAAIEDAAYPDGHPDLAITLTNLGTALYRMEEHDSAEVVLRRAVGMRREFLGPEHPGVATSLNSLALPLMALGRHEEAATALEESLAVYLATFGPSHPAVATASYNLARTLHGADRPTEAETEYRRALGIRREALGPEHPRAALVEFFLGRLLLEGGRAADARPLLEHAHDVYAANFEATNSFVVEARSSLVALFEELGLPDEADRYR